MRGVLAINTLVNHAKPNSNVSQHANRASLKLPLQPQFDKENMGIKV